MSALASRWLVSAPPRSGRQTARRPPVSARIRERTFWVVQLEVFLILALHVVGEGTGVFESGPAQIFREVSVVLYLVPVSHAGLHYGIEGGSLTAVWAALLTIPNLVVWHRDDFAWVGEILVLLFVLGTGVVVAVPVERERRQRRRTEAANRRLSLVNELSARLMAASNPRQVWPEVTRRLISALGLRDAALVAADHESVAEADGWPGSLLRAPAGADAAPVHRVADTWIAPVSVGSRTFAYLMAREPADGPLPEEDRALLVAVAHQLAVASDNLDLHEQEQARMQSYVAAVTRAQEEERGRIARDLHDVATHELLLLGRQIDAIAERDDAGTEIVEELGIVRDRSGRVVDYLRRFAGDLRPGVLEHLGLVPALEWLATRARDHTDLTIRVFADDPVPRLAPETELALFRIAQEAVRNADRHANADCCDVSISSDGSTLRLEVADDGTGFEPEASSWADEGRLGVLGMRERAQLIGGRLDLQSAPGEGTRIVVVAPITT